MTATPRRWVLASGNPGKLEEIRTLLAAARLDVVPQSAFGVRPAAETGQTFVENALLKARHAAAATGLPAIADDSGLVVDALGGAPGIRSARFAAPQRGDRANIDKLLALLDEVPEERRGAHFYCVIVALAGPADPAPLIGAGTWPGRVARAPRGARGFGYDPVFFDPQLDATAAELEPAHKNRVSHRSRALAAIRLALLADTAP